MSTAVSRILELERPEQIDLAQAARYLGARGEPDQATLALLERCAVPLLAAVMPRAVCLRAGKEELASLWQGADIQRHLDKCTEAVLMAMTLGPGVDAQIRRAGIGDVAAQAATDALASTLAEQVCDQAEAKLRVLAREEGLYLTGRYSPGYGDWPIAVQPRIAALLDTQKRIGLYVTDTFLMLPRKSVTAVMGLSNVPVTGRRAGCAHCALREKCEFRKRGVTCES